MIYGYARVSAKDQNLATQIDELERFGVDKIVSEKITGVAKKKNKLEELLISLKPSDTLVLTRMDRLGRDTVQLLQLVEELQERGISFVVLNLGIDTRTPTGKFFLTVMAGFSELDRTIIKEKQRNGIALAKKRGAYKGRKKKYTADHAGMNHAIELRKSTDKTVKEICEITGISEASFYRRWRELSSTID